MSCLFWFSPDESALASLIPLSLSLCLSKYKPVHSTSRPKLLLHTCGTVGLFPWIKVLHVKDAIYTSIFRQLFCQILPGSLMGWVRFPAGKVRQQKCKPSVQSPGKLNVKQQEGLTSLLVRGHHGINKMVLLE